MHAEALDASVLEFDEAVEARSCPYLNQLGETALVEVRSVYEQLDLGNYEALGELAERLAAAVTEKKAQPGESQKVEHTLAPTGPDKLPTDAELSLPARAEPSSRVFEQFEQIEVGNQPTIESAEAAATPAVEPLITQEAARQEPLVPRVVAKHEPLGARATSEKPDKVQAVRRSNRPLSSVVEKAGNDEQIKLPVTPQKKKQMSGKLTIARAATAARPERGDISRTVHEVVKAKPIEAENPATTGVLDVDEKRPEIPFDEPAEAAKVAETTINRQGLEVEPPSAENDYPEEITETSELTETFQTLEINGEETLPIPDETEIYTDEQLAAGFDHETVETYKALVALAAADEAAPLILEDSVEVQITATFESTRANETELFTKGFEAFIAEQPTAEEAVTLEFIKEQANEQPLEQTFVQLAELLANVAEEESPGAEQIELHKILQEIEVALPVRYAVNEIEIEEPSLRITPELTEKMIRLLSSLGYEHPKEALVDFVRQHDLTFLLQAFQYMCQLCHEDDRQEFLAVPIASTGDDDGATRLRIGKLLFKLIGELNFDSNTSAPVF